VEPVRTNDRKLTEEPKAAKSKTERLLPKRLAPYTLSVEPKRAYDLNDNAEPKLTKSKAEKLDPILENP
jgi:hypothetical protein